ncbi:MAG: glycoside hydrolase family 92 protein, partial [Lysobacter sp.]|nr:glycoside hydrolase family 92 protein [Lysobacter sp.]
MNAIAVRVALALCLLSPPAFARSLTDFVDPFIGTDGTGHTFPGASMPFGMVQPSPDNADRGWSYSSGYQYRAPKILGFSNTHISGAGIGELGDVLLQPSQGEAWDDQTVDFASAYDKRSETARPGYYAVTLRDRGVRVELTASDRVAFQRYTFDHPGRVQVLVDMQHGILFGEG